MRCGQCARELEIDVLRASEAHRVVDLVAVADELLETPCEQVELLTGELLIRIERVENGKPDLEVGEVLAWRHDASCFGRIVRGLDGTYEIPARDRMDSGSLSRCSLPPVETGLDEKRVLITGASGGIGSACAREFAAEGSRVALHYHQGRERAEALSQELGGAPVFGADLRCEDEVDELFRLCVEELGGLDICAAVAGKWPEEDLPVWQLPLERWEETIRGNLTVTYLTARAFLREVERSGHGSLVLIGSTAGLFGEAGHADYAAAKSALLHGLLLSLKNEIIRIAPLGRVNAVCPGWTESPMTRTTLTDPELVRRATRTMPLRKMGQPEDVARQVVVLASDKLSGHVTGQVVVVAGGMEGRLLHTDSE